LVTEASVVESIRKSESKLARDGCVEKNSKCKLVIDVGQSHVVLDGNELTRDNYPVCDCLVFIQGCGLNVVVAECKKKIRDPGHALKQLSNGWREAKKILDRSDIPCSSPECFAVLVAGGWNRAVDKKRAQKATIQMNGKRTVTLGGCGDRLSKLIGDL